MSKVCIFGAGQRARELKFLLANEKNIKTDFFVVDREYLTDEYFDSTGVIATEDLLSGFSPRECVLYMGIGMPKMNKSRERIFSLLHSRGFYFETFISSRANVYTEKIGEGTTVFAGVNIGPNVSVGRCNHFEMGVTVSHDCQIGDFNFFAPGCSLCGDIKIGRGNFIGANSTLRNSIQIQDYVLIGAGAYADKSLENGQVLLPARSTVLSDKDSGYFMR